MHRTSVVVAALLLFIVSSSCFALGLGEIDMQSALNQPMKADIELTSVSATDTSDIKVTLASREAHQRLGLSRAGILSSFKFSVEKGANGQPVIRVTSRDSVREPFLEFLLQVDWPNGKLMKQYTVLVDPPVTMAASPAIAAPPVSRTPVATPVRETSPQPRPATTRPAAAAPRPATVTTRAADEYGPIRRSETLWTIAKDVRPDRDISMDQMMIALQKANPQAFARNNINNLKTGVTLRVPGRDEILAMDSRAAHAEAIRQYEEWRQARQPAVDSPAEAAVVADEPAETDTSDAGADTEADTEVAVETESRLQLVAPEGEAVEGMAAPGDPLGDEATSGSGEGTLQQQLALASEEAEAGRAQSEELQTRVVELEQQIETMKRLLELKDDQLAGMQHQLGLDPDELIPDSAVPEEGEAGDEIVTALEAGESATGASDEVVNAEADAAAEEAAGEEGSEPDVEDETAVEEVAAATVDGVDEPRGIVNKVMDNPVLAGLGLLVAMLLGGFLWASTRQKHDQGMFDDEPTLAKYLEDEAAKSGGHSQPVVDFQTREPVNEPGTQHNDGESDPITEADVYLAYGRLQQAEDVLQNALQESPEDVDLCMKLLEVYHAAGNAVAFERYAMTLKGMMSAEDTRWQRMAELGHSMDPENLLYGETGDATERQNDNFDMDLSGMEADASGIAVESLPDNIDFSLDDQPAGSDKEQDDVAEGLLDDSDEVTTKLDLARAYIDMGDPEGARNILEEVMEEGSADQKREAESLVSGLA